jgi:hypothetical protein
MGQNTFHIPVNFVSTVEVFFFKEFHLFEAMRMDNFQALDQEINHVRCAWSAKICGSFLFEKNVVMFTLFLLRICMVH